MNDTRVKAGETMDLVRKVQSLPVEQQRDATALALATCVELSEIVEKMPTVGVGAEFATAAITGTVMGAISGALGEDSAASKATPFVSMLATTAAAFATDDPNKKRVATTAAQSAVAVTCFQGARRVGGSFRTAVAGRLAARATTIAGEGKTTAVPEPAKAEPKKK